MDLAKAVVLFALFLSLSTSLLAEQVGDGNKVPILTGSVSDAISRKPVKGVTISVTSSNGPVGRSFTTDEDGNFSIPRLPAGEVTIVLEKKGYKTYRKEKIVLKEGMQVKLNIGISNDKATSDEGNLFHPLLRMMES